IEFQAGRLIQAEDLFEMVLAEMDVAEEPGRWASMAARVGTLRLELGRPMADLVKQLERVTEYIWQDPQYGSSHAVAGDLFLGRFYAASDPQRAKDLLERSLRSAKERGNVDEEIAIQRELGNVARGIGQLRVAADHYHQSMVAL